MIDLIVKGTSGKGNCAAIVNLINSSSVSTKLHQVLKFHLLPQKNHLLPVDLNPTLTLISQELLYTPNSLDTI